MTTKGRLKKVIGHATPTNEGVVSMTDYTAFSTNGSLSVSNDLPGEVHIDSTTDGSTPVVLELVCNIRRSDTGADDTWVSTTTGQLPLLLEVDFHFEIDTVGSRTQSTK